MRMSCKQIIISSILVFSVTLNAFQSALTPLTFLKTSKKFQTSELFSSSTPSSNWKKLYNSNNVAAQQINSLYYQNQKNLPQENGQSPQQQPQPTSSFRLFDSNEVSTTIDLIASLWEEIHDATQSMEKGEPDRFISYPLMTQKLTRDYLSKIMAYFDTCKDICDDFGMYTILLPKLEKESCLGFIIKSYKTAEAERAIQGDDETGGFKFAQGHDPFWDDELEIDESYFDDDEGDEDEMTKLLKNLPPIENEVPTEDSDILAITKDWVNSFMTQSGVCPFTSGPDLAGLPLGKVRYHIERCSTLEETYAVYWREVALLQETDQKSHSTTLLITPNFCLNNIELFENFSTTLTKVLEPLGLDDALLQLVFFHPFYTFRDGFSGADSNYRPANYARRSPWPMINLLRTSQVRTAQRGIPTGLVYQQNERTMNQVGVLLLEEMLRKRDWTQLRQYKVDRSQMEALRMANDLQEANDTIKIEDTEDLSLNMDSTPAVNKVNKEKQIEGGDMVNIIKQAVQKRLETKKPLSGPETSATLMAVDFLMEELTHYAN